MQDIHDKLLVKGAKNGLTFTAELIPTHSRVAEKYGRSIFCSRFLFSKV